MFHKANKMNLKGSALSSLPSRQAPAFSDHFSGISPLHSFNHSEKGGGFALERFHERQAHMSNEELRRFYQNLLRKSPKVDNTDLLSKAFQGLFKQAIKVAKELRGANNLISIQTSSGDVLYSKEVAVIGSKTQVPLICRETIARLFPLLMEEIERLENKQFATGSDRSERLGKEEPLPLGRASMDDFNSLPTGCCPVQTPPRAGEDLWKREDFRETALYLLGGSPALFVDYIGSALSYLDEEKMAEGGFGSLSSRVVNYARSGDLRLCISASGESSGVKTISVLSLSPQKELARVSVASGSADPQELAALAFAYKNLPIFFARLKAKVQNVGVNLQQRPPSPLALRKRVSPSAEAEESQGGSEGEWSDKGSYKRGKRDVGDKGNRENLKGARENNWRKEDHRVDKEGREENEDKVDINTGRGEKKRMTVDEFWLERQKNAKIVSEDLNLNLSLTKGSDLHLSFFGARNFERMDDFFRSKGSELKLIVRRTFEGEWNVTFEVGGREEEVASCEFLVSAANQDFAIRAAEAKFVQKQFPDLFDEFINRSAGELDQETSPSKPEKPSKPEHPAFARYCLQHDCKLLERSSASPIDFPDLLDNIDPFPSDSSPKEVLKGLIRAGQRTISTNIKTASLHDQPCFEIEVAVEDQTFYRLKIQASKKNMAVDVASMYVMMCDFPRSFERIAEKLSE